jgi:hypothetical protein
MVIQNSKGREREKDRERERDTCCSVGEEKKRCIQEELISHEQRRGERWSVTAQRDVILAVGI